ncbi:thiosulfate/3-mercaptopyruvate sulfurtransferase [Kribbella voronezhensis]|uniref:Thiosulfate/3-mercaptopyruvate sulfurtransferase n=1 Tax=Kribbella voronezhensis TaxID=2512212 RepID=A0A4R7SYG7_9ACTN|nr:sulfurtransferase [Kribbella voronezhensis]TDU84364.1 thiosulfate/3-mercaptopyruvate sulfurtransferase [Kribbella voronezhensis]
MNPLITAESLRSANDSGTDRPVVIDVTWNLMGPPGRDAYDAGHLPGAHFVDLDTELAGPPGPGGRHPLPEATIVEAALRRAGVGPDTTVVVYDAANSMAAARAWWIFRYFGVRDVRVLDGGFAAWQAAGGEVSTTVPADAAGTFVASPGHIPMLDAEGAAALASTGVLLDARAPERFAGEVEPMDKVAGHIPGAVNAPTTANVTADGHFLSADELRKRFADLDVDASSEVGVYCGSGVTAAHEALALQIAGIEAPVYVGSWSEWITDPTRPIATGTD